MTPDRQLSYSIKKHNHILLKDYQGYLHIYHYFYQVFYNKNKDIQIKIGNINVDNKNAILFDLSSISSILMQMEFKRGSILFEYMSSKYPLIDEIGFDKLNELLDIIKNELENQETTRITFNISNDFNKLLYQGIEPTFKYEDIVSILQELIYKYLDNNLSKNIIIFYNSEIIPLDLIKYENVYYFDIGRINKFDNYNLLVKDTSIKELDWEIIYQNILDLMPIPCNEKIVYSYILMYFRYFIRDKVLYASNMTQYIVFYLLAKEYKQEVIAKNIVISDDIKSYLASL